MKTKVCIICGAIFPKPPSCGLPEWGRRKFCKPECRFIHQKGKKLSIETRRKMGLARSSSKNHKWKGDKVGYHALHTWVSRMLGKPDTCSKCGKSGLSKYKIQWANISGEYKRDLNDWVRLCVWCHLEFDGTSIERHKKFSPKIPPCI